MLAKIFHFTDDVILSVQVTSVCFVEVPVGKLSLRSECFVFALGTERGRVMLLLIDKEFKVGEGTHFLDLATVDYLTNEDLLRKRGYPKPPTALIIPLNDSMFRYIFKSILNHNLF